MLELGLFWAGVAITVAALLMLFFHAFKQNKGWGIVGLVLLIPLFIHIFLAWSALTVRKATYIFIIGVLAIIVSIAGGALEHFPFLTKHEVVQTLEENIAPPKETPLPNEEEAQAVSVPAEENYDPVLSGSEFEEVDVEDIVPPSSAPIQKSVAPKYVPVTRENLPAILNRQVRLAMANGETVDGNLTHIQDNALTVESAVEGGILGLSYKFEEIKTIEVRLSPGEEMPKLISGQGEPTMETDSISTETIPIDERVAPAVREEPVSQVPVTGMPAPDNTAVPEIDMNPQQMQDAEAATIGADKSMPTEGAEAASGVEAIAEP